MSEQKIIAIVGATGNQGSSTVKVFASLPNWSVRALTRDPSSAKAQELAALGAELFQVNLDDAETLKPAFEGVNAIFCLTTFWEAYMAGIMAGVNSIDASVAGYKVEINHVKNVANAAAKVPTLEKFIMSALGPMKEVSKGKYPHGYHWESKADSVKWIKNSLPDLAAKMSVFYPGAYATNLFLLPKKQPSGEYEMIMCATGALRFPIINERVSSGHFVRCLVEDEPTGTNLLGYDSDLSMLQSLEAWERVSGLKASFKQLTIEDMSKACGLPVEVLEAPAYMEEYGYVAGVENVKEPKDLKNPPKLKSYEEFLADQTKEFLLESKFPNKPSELLD